MSSAVRAKDFFRAGEEEFKAYIVKFLEKLRDTVIIGSRRTHT